MINIDGLPKPPETGAEDAQGKDCFTGAWIFERNCVIFYECKLIEFLRLKLLSVETIQIERNLMPGDFH